MGRHRDRAGRPDSHQHGPRAERAWGANVDDRMRDDCVQVRAAEQPAAVRRRYPGSQPLQRLVLPVRHAGSRRIGLKVGDQDERMVADRGEWYNKESGTLPGTMMGDPRSTTCTSTRCVCSPTTPTASPSSTPTISAPALPDRPGPVFVLPARVLVEQRKPRRQVPHDPGAGQASWGAVRARKGYRALRAEDMATITETATHRDFRGAGEAAAAAESGLLAAALGSVGGIREGSHGAAGRRTSSTPAPARPRARVACG